MRRLARLVGLSRTRKLPPAGPVRVVIFDFDGTIGDTFWQGLDILNELAGEFGFRPLPREELEKARRHDHPPDHALPGHFPPASCR